MTEKLWGGRFKQKTSRNVEDFTESVSIDHRLCEQDIKGSIAHAKMLAASGIITRKDASEIEEGLETILSDIASGSFSFDPALEDVHMNIEAELTKRIGEAGKRLHTARSRNDQVATDLRLYVRDEIDTMETLLARLLGVLASKAEENTGTLMPGMTHLQHAQPISFAHHLLAYFEMFLRDHSRLQDARKRLNVSPLGSAALAGTPHSIDRFMTAEELEFEEPCRNSIDGVSDRDFAIETVSDCSMIMMHLSRLAEEIVLWNSQEFSFVELSDAYCTGSSIMPQKKNPDVAELVRGKVGGVYGNLMNLLTIMKGLPLAYNRDMQEDKRPVLDSLDTTCACIEVMTGLVEGMKLREDSLASALGRGFITATDVADYLVEKGIAFRDAHRITGEIVAFLVEEGKTIEEMRIEDFRKFSDAFEEDIEKSVSAAGSVDRRRSSGGTARSNVKEAAAVAKATADRLINEI